MDEACGSLGGVLSGRKGHKIGRIVFDNAELMHLAFLSRRKSFEHPIASIYPCFQVLYHVELLLVCIHVTGPPF